MMELGNLLFGHSRGERPVPRYGGYEEELERLFDALGCDIYGVNFENDVFAMHPYYWGYCECEDEHDEDCPVIQPNFYHKSSGLKIWWYKYALRDSYSNQKLANFAEIIDECIESLKEADDDPS